MKCSMTYTTEDVKDFLYDTGELMVILDSDREYDLHIHDTDFDHEADHIETAGHIHDTDFDHEADHIETAGMMDGEYVIARFPASAIEHFRWHVES